MSFKKMGAIVALCLLVVIGVLIYVRDNVLQSPHGARNITDLSASYTADEEIAAARKALAEGIAPAEVVTTLTDGRPVVAIVFDGLPERPLCARLVDALAAHDAVATFFIEGQNAAQQPETIKLLRESDQKIGNYTFVGMTEMEKAPQETQLRELCRTQKTVQMLAAETPALFRAPRTAFTDGLLSAVRAAGLDYAVKENVRFVPNTLHSEADAAAYAATIPNGSIIAIPVGRPVAIKRYTPGKTDERPAVDMKPTIKDSAAVLEEKEDLADEVGRLLAALSARGVKVIFVDEFRKIRYIPAAVPLPGQVGLPPVAATGGA